MDTDWTFSSCSWLWEDDSEFKKECCVDPHTKEEEGKAFGDVKLHSETSNGAVSAIEPGNVPLPHNHQSNDNSDHGKKKKTLRGVNRGIPWTEDEHRRFLDGLEKYGKGDWKSIARFSVRTKSNSQVASHAQKYFKRLNSTSKDGKRHSINDVTIYDHLVTMPTCCSMFDSPFASRSIQEIERLMQEDDLGVDTPSSFGIPAIPEIQSLVQDDVVPNLSSFDFPCINDIQPVMRASGTHSGLCDPHPGSGIIPSLVHDGGAPGSSSFGIPSTSAETVDPDVFILPHFLDID
ncbi:transcription factor divaricata [Phtheirospermum japonicum]|uniref:Transcription factor divaricata n=1 Tax=Phtheirospermum japonicum TaxID=374723 RepID=A0A830B6P3_9LAMI|nr:transcription factor divaricata [Phtheirospermum japonicum]